MSCSVIEIGWEKHLCWTTSHGFLRSCGGFSREMYFLVLHPHSYLLPIGILSCRKERDHLWKRK